jgi:TPR repeat protein
MKLIIGFAIGLVACGKSGLEERCERDHDEAACRAAWEQLRDERDALTRKQFRFFQDDCELGGAVACKVVADAYFVGMEGVPKDPSKGKAILDGLCGKGDGKACGQLAMEYDRESDAPHARAAYVRGCDLHEGAACFEAGTAMTREAGDDEAAGRPYIAKACEYGFRTACDMVKH